MAARNCRQAWTEGEDRPRCSGHGVPMHKNGPKWTCAVKRNLGKQRETRAVISRGLCKSCRKEPLYTSWRCAGCTEDAREASRKRREANPDRIREISRRYESSRLRIYAGGMCLGSHRVDPSEKEKLQATLAGFRTQQRVEYGEASSGW